MLEEGFEELDFDDDVFGSMDTRPPTPMAALGFFSRRVNSGGARNLSLGQLKNKMINLLFNIYIQLPYYSIQHCGGRKHEPLR